MQYRNARRGFTLIELLVVILIIGILAAVALPQYQRTTKLAQYQQVVVFGDAFIKAQTLYYLEHGSYAKSFGELPISMPASHLQCALRFTDTDHPDIQCYPGRGLPTYQASPLANGGWYRICFAENGNTLHEYICKRVSGKENSSASGEWNF